MLLTGLPAMDRLCTVDADDRILLLDMETSTPSTCGPIPFGARLEILLPAADKIHHAVAACWPLVIQMSAIQWRRRGTSRVSHPGVYSMG